MFGAVQMRALVIGVFVLAALAAQAPSAAAAAAACAHADEVPTAATLAQARTATLCLLNAERSRRGLRPLRRQARLEKVASAYAAQMVRQQFFDHVAPDGTTFDRRIERGGYLRTARRWWIAENIGWAAAELSSPAGVVRSWMHSSGHRRTILTARYRDVGVGISAGAPEAVAEGVPAATYATEFGLKHTGR